MKLAITLLLIFSSGNLLANKIDSLKTDADVIKLIKKLYIENQGDFYDTFTFKKPDSVLRFYTCDSTILKWNKKSWEKIDFNKDGRTDLFATLYQGNSNEKYLRFCIYVIIDKGNNNFSFLEFPGYFLFNCYAAKPVLINKDPFIIYRHYQTEYIPDSLPKDSILTGDKYHYAEIGYTDTLVYKYGGFVEVTTTKAKSPVVSIYFETTPCLGLCPVFKLNIFKDGTAYYTGDKYDDKEGNFRTVLHPNELNELLNLVNYLDVSNLKDYYTMEATDEPSGDLSIFFANGTVKHISDYGRQGTLGLVRLYQMLFALRENQNWK